MKLLYALLLIGTTLQLKAQQDSVYTKRYLERSTRFAWLTYGGDLNYLTGGSTQQLMEGSQQPTPFGGTLLPRLTIGGIHFWGHADFYVSFPLSFLSYQNVPGGLQDLEVYQGVETGARLYPLKLRPQRLSPFLGISFRRIRYSQEPVEHNYANGTPSFGRIIHPIQFGMTYTTDKWHISASGYFNHQNRFRYFISPSQTAPVHLDPVSFNLSLLRYVDSDRHMRSDRAVRQVNRVYQNLKNANLLSAWFVGVGPSATLQVSKSPYLKEQFPFFYDDFAASVLPDITFGRFFHRPDLNLNLSYRTYGNTYEGFDALIKTRRHSVGLESTKFLFNWLGFVPFVGPALTHEHLRVTVNGTEHQTNKWAVGIVFGWDIRVTKTGNSLLRTNLRYFPDLHMQVAGEKMMFDQLEFNFIQWVQFLGRKKALKNKK